MYWLNCIKTNLVIQWIVNSGHTLDSAVHPLNDRGLFFCIAKTNFTSINGSNALTFKQLINDLTSTMLDLFLQH